MHRRTLSSSSLTGTRVHNPQEENLGRLEELMIDTETGHVAYAVLSFGGFLGLGDKLFAVPFSALRIDQENQTIYLDVDKETLRSAPGFDKDNWPDADLDYLDQIYAYYRIEPYWQTR